MHIVCRLPIRFDAIPRRSHPVHPDCAIRASIVTSAEYSERVGDFFGENGGPQVKRIGGRRRCANITVTVGGVASLLMVRARAEVLSFPQLVNLLDTGLFNGLSSWGSGRRGNHNDCSY